GAAAGEPVAAARAALGTPDERRGAGDDGASADGAVSAKSSVSAASPGKAATRRIESGSTSRKRRAEPVKTITADETPTSAAKSETARSPSHTETPVVTAPKQAPILDGPYFGSR